MKKVIISVIVLIIILGTSFSLYKYFQNNEETTVNNKNTEVEEAPKEEEVIKDTNPIVLGLYKYYGSSRNRVLQKEYSGTWSYHNDISSFEVFYTDEEEITGSNFQNTFKTYYESYENIDNYKIGYEIEFSTDSNKINKTILSPKDTEEFYNYLEVYLYDDYHRTPGVWYSHTTEEEMNDETLLTSIKLTSGIDIDKVTSDIILTVFTYDDDNFDSNNKYIGVSKYQITVLKP